MQRNGQQPKKQTGKRKRVVSKIVTNRIQHKKTLLIDALEKSMGVVTTACKQVGVDRTMFYDYVNDDPVFAQQVKSIENVALDFAESKLLKNIEQGKEISILFYLKCKGKHRGYIERTELDVRSQTEVTHKIESLKSLTDDQLNQLSEIARTLDGSE